jgi:hypothetical protein
MAQEPYNEYTLSGLANLFTKQQLEEIAVAAGFTLEKEMHPVRVVVEKETAEELVKFWEASEFGNLFGGLPRELQDPARKELTKMVRGRCPAARSRMVAMEISLWIVVLRK